MIFEDIYNYIQRPLSERQSHLNLNEQCVELGGRSTEFRALLAYELKTTIPKGMSTAYLCHACNNGKCCNPKHLYWGTPRENVIDMTNVPGWKERVKLGKQEYHRKKKMGGAKDRQRRLERIGSCQGIGPCKNL